MAQSQQRRASTFSMDEDPQKAKQKGPVEDKSMETLHVGVVHQVPLVDTEIFAIAMSIVVVCNVIGIGFETEFGHTTQLFGAVNNGFLLCYIVELMMRMLTHGLKAFKDTYTCMDLILVFLAFLERIMSSGALARALPTFRLLRTVRLLRRTDYFRHSRELNAISHAGVKMIRSLFWVTGLLFMVLWTLGTFAHMVIGHSAEWNLSMDPSKEFPPFVPFDIQQYFGSVSKSFFTLLQVVTLAQWAPHVARPIVKVYPITFLFFIFTLFVTTYGILISIVANLVQDSMAASKETAKLIKAKETDDRRKTGLQAREILAEVDLDGSGELDVDEIAYALEVTDLDRILRDLGVPVNDAESLVRLLDYNGNGLVSYDELVEGVVRMDEEITKRDYAMMGFWVKNLLERTRHLEERLTKICEEISYIRSRLARSFASLNHMIMTSKDSQLRQRSIHILRTSGPALPPTLDKTVIVKPTLAGRDAKVELQAFTSRFLGRPPKPKRSGSPGLESEPPRQVALFNNTLQDAPPPYEVGLRRARRRDEAWADRYAISTDFRDPADQGRLGRLKNPENPNLRALKDLL